MIKINDNSSIDISKLEKDQSFIFKAAWVEYGMHGVLPRFQLEVEGMKSEIDFKEFHLKIIYNGVLFVDSPAVVDSFNHQGGLTILTAFIVPSLEFVRDSSTKVYHSIDEIVKSLWSGTCEVTLPSGKELHACQMNEVNHKFLTRSLLCSSAEQSFYYSLKNSIVPVQLTSRKIDIDLTKDSEDTKSSLVQFAILDGVVRSSKGRHNFIKEFTGNVSEKSITVAGEDINYADSDHITLEENGMRTNLAFNKPQTSFMVEYSTLIDVKLGDVVKMTLGTGTITFMLISTKILIDTDLRISSRCIEYAD